VKTGPRFSGIDQNGHTFSGRDYPLVTGKPLTVESEGTLSMDAEGGAGPAFVGPDAGGLGSLVAPITPAKAENAVDVKIKSGRKALVVGAPKLDLAYRGKIAGPRPARVFAQLIDDRTGLVVGNQITPVPLTLDGKSRTLVNRPLEIISQKMKKGDSLTLQLVASNVTYANPRLGGNIKFSTIGLSLPTLKR
jgi:ABC-2 type transport system ATP-binding protein